MPRGRRLREGLRRPAQAATFTTMTDAVRIGMLVPSSNTVAEPYTQAMLAATPDITLHVARFRVTRLDLSDAALAQFVAQPLLDAASLLADAKMGAICLNATASCYTGLAGDRALVSAIREATGIPGATAMLGLETLLKRLGARRIGLVTPFLHDVQEATLRVLRGEGWPIVAERHLNDPGNYSFATWPDETVAGLVREVAAEGVDCVAIVSTNLRGGLVAPALERELGIPVLDTVATALWAAIAAAGADPRRIRGWGRAFDEAA
jgi:maleate isomerase